MSQEHTLGLYTANRGRLVSHARRILGDSARAEDLVHDAWLIYDRLPDREAVRDPVSYLHRMVHNLAINAVRHISLRQRLTGGDWDTASDRIADPGPSAEASLIARQCLDRVMTRLAALPERQQTAIRMHRLEGHKMREIAERLGVSVGLVHALIADGLTKCADPPEEQA